MKRHFAPNLPHANGGYTPQLPFMNTHCSKNLVGPEIRKLRCQRGWTQAKLAKILAREGLDITRSSLAKVECQLVWVGDFELLYFVRALGVRLEHLFHAFGGEDIISALAGTTTANARHAMTVQPSMTKESRRRPWSDTRQHHENNIQL